MCSSSAQKRITCEETIFVSGYIVFEREPNEQGLLNTLRFYEIYSERLVGRTVANTDRCVWTSTGDNL